MADSSNGNPAATNSGEPPSTLSPVHGGPAQPGMVPYQAGGMLPQRRGMRGFEPPIEDEGASSRLRKSKPFERSWA